jgi:hypothetical protein
MKHLRGIVIVFAIVALSAIAFGQPGAIPAPQNPGVLMDAFQVNYLPSPVTAQGVAGGAVGGYVNITNAGQLGAPLFGPNSPVKTGNICVNVYTFTADEQESECCSCLVTPNALVHLTAADLVGNPGNGVTPTLGLVVKLVSTIPSTDSTVAGTNAGPFTGTKCNAALPFTTVNLAPGMRAWAVKFHSNNTIPGGTPTTNMGVTETAFLPANLSSGELAMMTNLCQFLSGNQSGAGICKSCSLGGIGGSKIQ